MDTRFQGSLADAIKTTSAQGARNARRKEEEVVESILKRHWNSWRSWSIQSRQLPLSMINCSTTTAFTHIFWSRRTATDSQATWNKASYQTAKSSSWEEPFQHRTSIREMHQHSSICNSLPSSRSRNHWIQSLWEKWCSTTILPSRDQHQGAEWVRWMEHSSHASSKALIQRHQIMQWTAFFLKGTKFRKINGDCRR